MTREPDSIVSYADSAAAPVLIVAEPTGAADAVAAVELVGARLVSRIDWTGVAAVLDAIAIRPILLVEAEGVADALLVDALPALSAWVATHEAQVVVTLGEEQIDVVSAHLFGRGIELICRASLSDRVAALALAIEADSAMVLSDSWRESDAARLRRLNEEVARIADVLARLSRGGRAADGQVADPGAIYDTGAALFETIYPQDIRRLIRARRLRDQFFGEGLFEDPAWDMLLDLFAAELEQVQVSVSSLCIAAAVAPTTALRWIAKLTECGLLIRHPDPIDRRRAFITLSPKASVAMRGYMIATKDSACKSA